MPATFCPLQLGTMRRKERKKRIKDLFGRKVKNKGTNIFISVCATPTAN